MFSAISCVDMFCCSTAVAIACMKPSTSAIEPTMARIASTVLPVEAWNYPMIWSPMSCVALAV
jgi:hypothetical protein